jgi:CHAT domain-containing protein
LRTSESRKAADNIRQAAAIALELRDFERARTLLSRSTELERSFSYAEGEIISLSMLSEIGIRSGDMERAEAALASANKISLPVSHPESEATRHLANAEWEYSRFNLPETIRLASIARELWIVSGNVAKRIEANGLIAYAHAALYEPLEAERFIEESLALATATGNDRARAITMSQQAFALALMNEPVKALNVCREAEKMFPPDLDLGEQAQLVNGIAGVYWLLGDLKTSSAYSTRAFELFGRDKSPRGQLATLVSLVESSFALGDPDKAFEYRRQAEALSEQLKNDYFIAIVDRFVANHYLEIGEIGTAIEYYETSLKRLTRSGFKSGISALHSNLGESYLRQGDLGRARQHFESANEINRSVSDKFAESQALFDLARLSRIEGDLETSNRLIDDSIRATENLRDKLQNQKLRSEYFATVHDRYSFAITSLIERGQLREGFQLAERVRAREMMENISASDAGIFADADQETVDRERAIRINLNAKADKLTDVLRRGEDVSQVPALEQEIDRLQHQFEEIRAELKRKSPVYSAIKDPPPLDLGDFQTSVLDQDSILLEYFLGKDRSYMWIVGKNGLEAFSLPARETIENKVDELRAAIEARKPVGGETLEQMRTRIADADSRYVSVARELSDIILGPVADKLGNKRIIVVPDGKLHTLAINALPLPNTNSNEPILLTNEVVYQPSAQTFSLLTKLKGTEDADRRRDLLVFSDPVFSKDDARLSGVEVAISSASNLRFAESLEGLQRLPASGREAESIADVIGGRADQFTGFRSTRENLLATALADYKVIHLATHGLIDPDRPELSAVILSRFDESGRPLDESVRMQDIYAMKLNADLVVLSACQTAAGKEIKGEGVMGLNSAFLQAGARSVVASLWQVEDNATNMLMREFYSGMARGLTVSAALREAQLTLYRDPQFRSPFFWASFTLQGDMNRRPEIGSSVLSTWWPAAIPVLILIGLLAARRLSFGTKKGQTK